MQLWERGLLELDAPANDYLRAFRLVSADGGWRPATVRNLLTHTAGVSEWVRPLRMVRTRWFGESFALAAWQWSLAPYGRIPITALRRSARSSRTLAAGRWTAT